MGPDEYVFADIAGAMFHRGMLRGAYCFIFCPVCQDVVEAEEIDSNTCDCCGFSIPDRLPRDMSERVN